MSENLWLTQIASVGELYEAEYNLIEAIKDHDRHEQTYRDMLVELREEISRRVGGSSQ